MKFLKRPKLTDAGWFYMMLFVMAMLIVVAMVCGGCSGFKLFEFEDAELAAAEAEKARMSADKQLLENMRPHIEVQLPRLKGFIDLLYDENRISEDEYLPIAMGFEDYEVDLAALLLDLQDIEAAKGLLETLSQWTSVPGIIDMIRGGGGGVPDAATMGRLAAIERMTREHGVTIVQIGADLAAMRRLIEDRQPVEELPDPRSTEELLKLREALDEVLRLRGEK